MSIATRPRTTATLILALFMLSLALIPAGAGAPAAFVGSGSGTCHGTPTSASLKYVYGSGTLARVELVAGGCSVTTFSPVPLQSSATWKGGEETGNTHTFYTSSLGGCSQYTLVLDETMTSASLSVKTRNIPAGYCFADSPYINWNWVPVTLTASFSTI